MDIKDNFNKHTRHYPNLNASHNIAAFAKMSGKTRKTSWLYKMALNGKLADVFPGDAQNFGVIIDSMITIFKRVYGQNFEIHLEPKWIKRPSGKPTNFTGYQIWFLIRFPEFIITNSNDKEHTIKDLIVGLPLKSVTVEDGKRSYYLRDPWGCRTTLSYPEYFKGYRHSHLAANKPGSYSGAMAAEPFCLGSNELNDLIATLRGDGFAPELFELFLLTIDSMVRWESLEGTPYQEIRNISIGKKHEATNLNNGKQEEYFLYFHQYIDSLDVDFVFSSGRYRIVHNSKFTSLVKKIIQDQMPDSWKNLIVTSKDGKYYGYESPQFDSEEKIARIVRNPHTGEHPYTYIQGKKLKFKVLDFSGLLPSFDNYVVHPKFLEYAAEQLERLIYEKAVRKATLERETFN